MIIEIHDVWNSASKEHEKYVRGKLAKAWADLYQIGPPTEILNRVRSLIDKHENEILDARTRDYSASINDYDVMFPPDTEERKIANTVCKKLFNYDSFRDARKGWSAYSLCSTSRYIVCPYCHIELTKTDEGDSNQKGSRPQLDHFIARSEYPFLALSLGNLVPSCADCNGSQMKHETNVLTTPLLFPLADASVLKFRLRPKSNQSWSPLLQSLRVPLDRYEIEIAAPIGNKAADNSLRTFKLLSRYQSFLHDAYRIAKVGRNPAWLQMISSRLGLTLSIQDHLGFSIDEDGAPFKNVPQGKMRMDIYQDSRNW